MRRVLLCGQFGEPVSGEQQVNLEVKRILSDEGFLIDSVDTSLIDDISQLGRFSFQKLLKMFLVYVRFARMLPRVDVVYFTPGQSLLGVLRFFPLILLASLFNKEVIAHWHGYGILNLTMSHRLVVRIIVRLINKNIFLTYDLLKRVQRTGVNFRSCSVVYNFSNIGHCDYTSHGSLKVLFLGSIMEEKGIKVFMEVAKRVPSVEFLICGAGDPEIIEAIKELCKRSENVQYDGVVEGEHKSRIYLMSDIFVLPTSYINEGMPLALLDAMTTECAIITTRHNGIPETVEDAAIFANDCEDLVSYICTFEQNPKLLELYKKRAVDRSCYFTRRKFKGKILSVFGKAA